MAYTPDYRTYPGAQQQPGAVASAAALDAGLRAYMLRVYNWMTSGLLLTGVVAYGIANTSLISLLYQQVSTPRGLMVQPTMLAYVAIFAPLVFVMVLSLGVNRLSRSTAQLLYWAFAAAMGASLSNIFLIYAHELDRPRLLRHGGDVRGGQHLRLHHAYRPYAHGQLSDDGPVRCYHRQRGEHVHWKLRLPVPDQHRRRAGVRRPHRLRHPADQG